MWLFVTTELRSVRSTPVSNAIDDGCDGFLHSPCSRHKLKHLDANLGHTTICNPQAARGAERKVKDAVAKPGPRSLITTTTDLLVAAC